MSATFNTAQQLLRDVFGHAEFRPGQDDIIRSVLSGRDTLGVLPTGAGKSACYQVPALVFPACTLVVSPLIALMMDQVDKLRSRGVAAYALSSTMSQSEIAVVLDRAQRGEVKLLYVAPERLERKGFRERLATISLSLLVVDEAHCISEWGHDFRPAYRSIVSLFETRPRVPIAALTATATPDVRADIVKVLGLKNHVEIVRGFDRPNLSFRVENTPHKIEYIVSVARKNTGAMLVYAGSRRKVDTLTDELKKRGIAASAYHAGRTSVERTFVQERFVRGETNIMVATNAFGLGIDKGDVRNVVHTDLALSLEAYYQEAGRAGRDGADAACTLLYQKDDRRLMDFFISCAYPEPKLFDEVVSYLFDRASTVRGEQIANELLVDEASIAADLHKPVGAVKGVVSSLERHGALMRTAPGGLARLRLRSSMERLSDFVEHAPMERKAALLAIERLLASAALQADLEFSLHSFIQKSGISITEFTSAIRALHAARILRFSSPSKEGGLMLTVPRPRFGRDLVDMEAITVRREHAVSKLEIVVRYAETPQCKRNFILNYFNDHEVRGECGRCSSCKASPVEVHVSHTDSDTVLSLIQASLEVSGRFGRNTLVDIVTGTVSSHVESYRLDRAVSWGSCSKLTRSNVMRVLDDALEQGILHRTGTEYPLINVSAAGRKLISKPPKRLDLDNVQKSAVDLRVLSALVALRNEIGDREGAPPTSLTSLLQLERLAADRPTSEAQLVPGNHGSALFLAKHGKDVIDVIARTTKLEPIVKIRADETSLLVSRVANAGGSLTDVARRLKQTSASTAQAIQRALEAGIEIDRGQLVSDVMFEEVLEFMRNHRYAKLRHVREHLDSTDVDLPSLRVAMAFVRRELYGVSEQ